MKKCTVQTAQTCFSGILKHCSVRGDLKGINLNYISLLSKATVDQAVYMFIGPSCYKNKKSLATWNKKNKK